MSAYAYDALGRRTKALDAVDGVPSTMTIFIYSGNRVLFEQRYQVPSTITSVTAAMGADLSSLIPTESVDYVQANGSLLAKFTAPNGGSETVAYFHQDHLGSTRLETDATGKVVARLDYEPFGATMPGITLDEPYAFTGQRNDGATGLYYYGARFYDPAIGRFITQDPAQDGMNWYVYCGNNAVNYVDPSGCVMVVDDTVVASNNDPDTVYDLQGGNQDLVREINESRVYDIPNTEIAAGNSSLPLGGPPESLGQAFSDLICSAPGAYSIGTVRGKVLVKPGDYKYQQEVHAYIWLDLEAQMSAKVGFELDNTNGDPLFVGKPTRVFGPGERYIDYAFEGYGRVDTASVGIAYNSSEFLLVEPGVTVVVVDIGH